MDSVVLSWVDAAMIACLLGRYVDEVSVSEGEKRYVLAVASSLSAAMTVSAEVRA